MLTLTACELPTNNGNQNQNNTPTEPSTPEEKANDAAITILNNTAFFPEVGDEVDLSTYVTFDAGFGHTLSEYTFTSSDPTVISIENYHATCLKSGFTSIQVEGPGINRKTVINFLVGSIAGTYKPDLSRIHDKIQFTVGEVDENRMSDFTLSIQEGNFRSSNQHFDAYEGSGKMFKNGTPFLTLRFDGQGPANFSPISQYLAKLGLSLDLDIAADVYGLMSYDVEFGVSIRTIFFGEVVEFLRAN